MKEDAPLNNNNALQSNIDPEAEIRELVNRHMQNQEHKTTEEELSNLHVGMQPTPDDETASEENADTNTEVVTPPDEEIPRNK